MISTKHKEEIELEGNEKLSFLNFLYGKSEKTVNLERVLGIGGEGIVLAQKMDTREYHYKDRKNWFGKNKAGWIEKKGRDVALKFVQFEKDANENFRGPEKEDENGYFGGIKLDSFGNEKWVTSQFFERLKKLGDFKAATHWAGGYSRPYLDFGISWIHNRYYYVIG